MFRLLDWKDRHPGLWVLVGALISLALIIGVLAALGMLMDVLVYLRELVFGFFRPEYEVIPIVPPPEGLQ
ncbi:MAG: hypothetical protein Q8Q39_05790 [bacterium]|nr:hypothetical protein [bacterium]